MDLRLLSKNFFSVGQRLAEATGDNQLRKELRSALSGERYEKVFDWSQNSGDRDVSELCDKLTTDEVEIFEAGYKAAAGVRDWKRRRTEKLQTNAVFKKSAAAAALG